MSTTRPTQTLNSLIKKTSDKRLCITCNERERIPARSYCKVCHNKRSVDNQRKSRL
jgi:hypothetical protein